MAFHRDLLLGEVAGKVTAMQLIDNPPIRLRWCDENDPGHPGEYLVHIDGASLNHHINELFTRDLQRQLDDDWKVSNRGTRVEIFSHTEHLGQDHDLITATVNSVVTQFHNDQMSLIV